MKGAINIGSDIAQKPILLKNTNNDKVHTIELEGLASAKLDTPSAPNGVLAAEKAEPVSSTINTSSLQSQANAKNSSVNEIKSQTSFITKENHNLDS